MSLDELKSAWGLIDLENHLFKANTTSPEYNVCVRKRRYDRMSKSSDRVVDVLEKGARRPEVLRLNCGHSSVGIFPFNLIAAHRYCDF